MPRFIPRLSNGLTARQQEVLDFIRQYYQENGICPSSRILQAQFGFASQTAAMGHIDKLVRKGHLTKCPHSGRIIIKDERIPWEDLKALFEELWEEKCLYRVDQSVTNFFDKYPHLRDDLTSTTNH